APGPQRRPCGVAWIDAGPERLGPVRRRIEVARVPRQRVAKTAEPDRRIERRSVDRPGRTRSRPRVSMTTAICEIRCGDERGVGEEIGAAKSSRVLRLGDEFGRG